MTTLNPTDPNVAKAATACDHSKPTPLSDAVNRLAAAVEDLHRLGREELDLAAAEA